MDIEPELFRPGKILPTIINETTSETKILANAINNDNIDSVRNGRSAHVLEKPEFSKTENVQDLQKVTITKDGRKRIQPVFINSPNKKTVTSSPSNDQPQFVIVPNSQNTENLTKYILPVVQESKQRASLAIPIIRQTFTQEMHLSSNFTFSMEIKSSTRGAKLRFMKVEEVVWKEDFSSPAILAVISPNFVAISFADCNLSIFSLAGRKIFPTLRMSSAVSFLTCQNEFLLHIDCTGNLNVW